MEWSAQNDECQMNDSNAWMSLCQGLSFSAIYPFGEEVDHDCQALSPDLAPKNLNAPRFFYLANGLAYLSTLFFYRAMVRL